eukprot:GFUD01001674.1.p1 GENE.GFUD01001674.1~~GFUD01001674.1.p1  ORF type:complete len:214 (-),score=67.69 GFUD01001674.1:288-929(-)
MICGCLRLAQPGQMYRTVRQYFKPGQKEAFYDVEGVVTKDTLLFRYEDPTKVFRKNMLAMAMMPLWGYLGYYSYSLKSKVEPFREEVVDNTRINFLLDNVSKASRGVGLAYFLFGAGLSSYWVIRTMNTVRRLVLRKGGKYVSIQTYGLSGGGGRVENVPVVHCSGIQHTFYGKQRFFLKVRDHSFKYQFNLEEGVVSNKPLFDRTVGIGRRI